MGSIFEQYREQRRKLAASYITPTRITFSPAGYTKMMSEHESTSLNNTATPAASPSTYDGWPYNVVNDQPEEVKLHNAMTDSPRGRQNAITVKIDGIMSGAPVVEILAQNLSAAQLCDIIMAWLGQDPHWGDFEKELHAVVEKHGTFE